MARTLALHIVPLALPSAGIASEKLKLLADRLEQVGQPSLLGRAEHARRRLLLLVARPACAYAHRKRNRGRTAGTDGRGKDGRGGWHTGEGWQGASECRREFRWKLWRGLARQTTGERAVVRRDAMDTRRRE